MTRVSMHEAQDRGRVDEGDGRAGERGARWDGADNGRKKSSSLDWARRPCVRTGQGSTGLGNRNTGREREKQVADNDAKPGHAEPRTRKYQKSTHTSTR